VIAFSNGSVTVISNIGSVPVELPVATVLLASEAVDEGVLPVDTTVWLAN
jgi:alpha-glucosidase